MGKGASYAIVVTPPLPRLTPGTLMEMVTPSVLAFPEVTPSVSSTGLCMCTVAHSKTHAQSNSKKEKKN